MAKVTGPFLSLDARGTLADVMTASVWKGINYLRLRVVPNNPRSDAQQAIRSVLSDGVSKWRFGMISSEAKTQWENYAKGLAESGFNRFMRAYIQANYDSNTKQKVTPQVIPDPS